CRADSTSIPRLRRLSGVVPALLPEAGPVAPPARRGVTHVLLALPDLNPAPPRDRVRDTPPAPERRPDRHRPVGATTPKALRMRSGTAPAGRGRRRGNTGGGADPVWNGARAHRSPTFVRRVAL